jgi:PemK-like, MazF-like toxin of type II toxin-antitoxin system
MPRWLDALVEPLRRAASTVRHAERGAGRTTRQREPTTRLLEAGVRIEYTPQLDGDPDPGEVVWTWVPFEDDPTLGKDRPVVIVGRHGALLSGVALTTRHKERADHVDVGTGPWDPQGRPSYAKVDRLLDIDPDRVRREGAVLSRRRFDAVVEAVDRLHDVMRT